MRLSNVLAACLVFASTTALAEGLEVAECDRFSHMSLVVEPWEENSRSFYEGQVRAVLVDGVEPACCWAHLVVLLPSFEEGPTYRNCVVVNAGQSLGFAGLDFASLAADYDPATGLLIRFNYGDYDPATGGVGAWHEGRVTVNLETGVVTAE